MIPLKVDLLSFDFMGENLEPALSSKTCFEYWLFEIRFLISELSGISLWSFPGFHHWVLLFFILTRIKIGWKLEIFGGFYDCQEEQSRICDLGDLINSYLCEVKQRRVYRGKRDESGGREHGLSLHPSTDIKLPVKQASSLHLLLITLQPLEFIFHHFTTFYPTLHF